MTIQIELNPEVMDDESLAEPVPAALAHAGAAGGSFGSIEITPHIPTEGICGQPGVVGSIEIEFPQG